MLGNRDCPILGARDYPILGTRGYPLLESGCYSILGTRDYPILRNRAYPILGIRDYPICGNRDYPTNIGSTGISRKFLKGQQTQKLPKSTSIQNSNQSIENNKSKISGGVSGAGYHVVQCGMICLGV